VIRELLRLVKDSSSASWLSLGEEKRKLVAGNCLG